MATYTQIINSVLRRLRESEVAGPTSSAYATMLGDLVNETKREVEDAHRWHSLRTQVQVTTAASTNGYSITGAGQRFKWIDSKRWAYDQTNESIIYPRDSRQLKRTLIENTVTGKPYYYYIEGVDASGDPKVYFVSQPDGVYTINFDIVIPQADLSSGTDVITVPEWPVILGTYAKALAERGEDNGRTHGEAYNQYQSALSDAVAIDAQLSGEELYWSID